MTGEHLADLHFSFSRVQTDFRESRKERDRKLSDVNYKLSLFVSDLKGEIEAAKLGIIVYTIGLSTPPPPQTQSSLTFLWVSLAALIGIIVFIGFGFKTRADHTAAKEKEKPSPLILEGEMT